MRPIDADVLEKIIEEDINWWKKIRTDESMDLESSEIASYHEYDAVNFLKTIKSQPTVNPIKYSMDKE